MMKTFFDWLALKEMATQATIYKSSQTKGATVDERHANEPIVMLNISDIINYEMANKMLAPSSQINMQNIMQGIRDHVPLPPIYVRKSPNLNYKYMVVDGHHRYWTYIKAGLKQIPARILAPENIQYKSKYVASDDTPDSSTPLTSPTPSR
jgi:hypothetical protein